MAARSIRKKSAPRAGISVMPDHPPHDPVVERREARRAPGRPAHPPRWPRRPGRPSSTPPASPRSSRADPAGRPPSSPRRRRGLVQAAGNRQVRAGVARQADAADAGIGRRSAARPRRTCRRASGRRRRSIPSRSTPSRPSPRPAARAAPARFGDSLNAGVRIDSIGVRPATARVSEATTRSCSSTVIWWKSGSTSVSRCARSLSRQRPGGAPGARRDRRPRCARSSRRAAWRCRRRACAASRRAGRPSRAGRRSFASWCAPTRAHAASTTPGHAGQRARVARRQLAPPRHERRPAG